MSRPHPDPRILATRMSAARQATGLTQRRLAARLGVSASTVAMWESGHRTPSVYDLHAYLRVVGARIVLGAPA
jgi:transcriptional regulator with XRE-family HTH domain